MTMEEVLDMEIPEGRYTHGLISIYSELEICKECGYSDGNPVVEDLKDSFSALLIMANNNRGEIVTVGSIQKDLNARFKDMLNP